MMQFLITVVLVLAPGAWANCGTTDLSGENYFAVKDEIKFKSDLVPNTIYGDKTNGLCSGGMWQSPIDLKSTDTIKCELRPLRFDGLFQNPKITTITLTLDKVTINLRTDAAITVTGGTLGKKVYQLKKIIFHWGMKSYKGSEHTVDSKRFPLESYLIFNKIGCADVSTDYCKAILGVHYELNGKGSEVLDPIMKLVDQKKEENGGYPLRNYLPTDIDSYFSYDGSFTTPPCKEGVRWIWFSKTKEVTSGQLKMLNDFTEQAGKGVQSSNRGVQALNRRKESEKARNKISFAKT